MLRSDKNTLAIDGSVDIGALDAKSINVEGVALEKHIQTILQDLLKDNQSWTFTNGLNTWCFCVWASDIYAIIASLVNIVDVLINPVHVLKKETVYKSKFSL